MPSILIRALRRSAWSMKGRLVAAGLILGCALAIYVGLYSAIDSLFASRDQWYAELAAADLDIRVLPEGAANIPALTTLPGVIEVEPRLMLPGNIDLANGHKLYALMVAQAGAPTLNRLRIESGTHLDPAHPDEVVIERSLARHHGLKVGDRLRLNVGQDHYILTVRGIALSPEFLIDSANPNFFLPSKGSLGVVYVPYSLIEARLGYRLVNSLLVRLDPRVAAPEQLEKSILTTLRPRLTIEESLPQARQFGHLYLNLDLGAFKIFVPAIVLIFVFSALIITVFVITQWIMSQQQAIGLMLSLGYHNTQIAWAFSLPVWLIAGVALSSGALLSIGLLYGFGHSYATALGLPEPVLMLELTRFISGLIGTLVILVIAVALPLTRLLKLTPMAALRGPSPARSGLRLSLPRWLKTLHATLAMRYALRNIQRARMLNLVSGATVALSLGAALAYFVSLTSFEHSIVQRLQHDDWDVAVDFLAPIWPDELSALRAHPGVHRTDPFLRGAVTLHAANTVEPSFLLGIDPSSPARTLRIVAGRALQASDRGNLVLERKTAHALGLKIGDTFTLRARNQDWPVTLVGIFSGVLPGESYATLVDTQTWLDLPEQINGAFLKTQADPDLPAQLYPLERVGRVTPKARLITEFVAHLREIAVIVYLAFALSLLVAVLFVFTTTAAQVLRRQPEYITLRFLGLDARTLGGILLYEVTLVGWIGCALAAIVGVAISMGLNAVLSAAWFQIDTSLNLRDFLWVLLPAMVLLPLTAWPALRTFLQRNLSTALRQRSIG